jgi:hypothetical protein
MDPFVVRKRGVLKAGELELPGFFDVSLVTSNVGTGLTGFRRITLLSILKNLINPVY